MSDEGRSRATPPPPPTPGQGRAPSPPGGAAPSAPQPPPPATRRAVRWGGGDLLWVLLAQFVASGVAEGVYRAVADVPLDDEISAFALFWLVLPAGAAASLATLSLIAHRKGRGSLRADFGFTVRLRDATALLQGLGWQVVLIALLAPLALMLDVDEPAQDLVNEIEETRSALAWVGIVLGVVVVQPVVEEIAFRGLLLRAALRRFAPGVAIGATAAVFGAIHVFGTGFELAAVPTVVGLTGFGAVLAVQALRHDSLSRPILVHAGFNLAVLLLAAVGDATV